MKDGGNFLGREKKQRDILGGWGLRDVLGYAKESCDYFGSINSEVVIFLGYKI